jgi:hypothetical protein
MKNIICKLFGHDLKYINSKTAKCKRCGKYEEATLGMWYRYVTKKLYQKLG